MSAPLCLDTITQIRGLSWLSYFRPNIAQGYDDGHPYNRCIYHVTGSIIRSFFLDWRRLSRQVLL